MKLIKRLFYILPIFALILSLSTISSGCSNNKEADSIYGKKITINESGVYYKPLITEEEAKKLCQYLSDNKFKHTIQLSNANDIYEFRMAVKAGSENDQGTIEQVKMLAAEISKSVFGGKKVDVHLCDGYFKTLKVVSEGNL